MFKGLLIKLIGVVNDLFKIHNKIKYAPVLLFHFIHLSNIGRRVINICIALRKLIMSLLRGSVFFV